MQATNSDISQRSNAVQTAVFAAEGKVRATTEQFPLESINEVFTRLKQGKVNGRVVLNMAHS